MVLKVFGRILIGNWLAGNHPPCQLIRGRGELKLTAHQHLAGGQWGKVTSTFRDLEVCSAFSPVATADSAPFQYSQSALPLAFKQDKSCCQI